MEEGTEREHAQAHDDETGEHHRSASEPVDKSNGDEGGQHIDRADEDRAPHLLGGGIKAGFLEDARRVIHDDIDAGELLDDLQSDSEKDGTAEVAIVTEEGETLLLDLEARFNFGQFPFRLRIAVGQTAQHLERFGAAFLEDKPARAFRQKEHAEEHEEGRNGDDPEHPTPRHGEVGMHDHLSAATGQGAERLAHFGGNRLEIGVGGEKGVAEEGEHDANGDHQLVHGNKRTADIPWRDF